MDEHKMQTHVFEAWPGGLGTGYQSVCTCGAESPRFYGFDGAGFGEAMKWMNEHDPLPDDDDGESC